MKNSPIVDLESTLKAFVSWCIDQSYSNFCTQDTDLELLECAWKAQELLWKLRQQADEAN